MAYSTNITDLKMNNIKLIKQKPGFPGFCFIASNAFGFAIQNHLASPVILTD